ncbi:MAG: FlgB family protein [Paracoccaceae bacterium]
MFEKLEISRMAQTMAAHAGARLGVVAQNIAHADSPGYKTRDLPSFAETYAQSGGKMRATRANHLGGAAKQAPEALIVRSQGAPNGNTVSLETEMVKAVEVKQQHEMALAINSTVSDILRASLGRKG